ncbi:Alpha/Beta hydrolase protein [Trametes elegans]|nr:Alpha/Beta hydrolase protein [Trametes elegans]
MIDHLFGRPSVSWKRTQVILVVIFWFWRILQGDPNGPRLFWLRRANRALQRFTPWQLIVSTLTGVYAVRNLDKILGLAAPEPLANLYSPSYYRATWIAIGLDAGFATAMTIRPRWLKDICSVLFSIYYIIYANEADEKIRKYRAVPTVEMLRTTWEKTTNPYLRMLSHHPRISVRRKVLLARPKDSTYRRPMTAWLFFAPPADQLARATDLILDFPGGGFVSMTPEHHEERLRMWAIRTGKPVLSADYGKAPEYPYPFSIDECFDLYRVLVETTGMAIGMSGHKLNIICTGDSAGAHIAVCVMFKILETQMDLPHPLALILNYAALDFNFTSWMTPKNLRVLQTEQSSRHLSMLAEQKDHLRHISPLSMVGDRKVPRRRRSLRDTLRTLASPSTPKMPPLRSRHTTSSIKHVSSIDDYDSYDDGGAMGDAEDEPFNRVSEEDKPLRARIRFNPQVSRAELEEDIRAPEPTQQEVDQVTPSDTEKAPIGTRLTMTSRTGYFQDRIISPSMMRAMAILYIGPHRNPDFEADYQLSPILAPDRLLAQFPPLLMSCGEKDPFVDDTLVFAGRVREAKRARRAELERVLGVGARAEELRMTALAAGNSSGDGGVGALREERARLARESEEDWVQMHIFSEWSHGYLQMPSLMREARVVIDDLADWMGRMFARDAAPAPAPPAGASPSVGVGAGVGVGGRGGRAPRDGIPPAQPGGGRGASAPQPRRTSTTVRATDDGDGLTSATETSELDTDEVLSFSPKRRSPPGSFAGAAARRLSQGRGGGARPPSSSPRGESVAADATTETYRRVGPSGVGRAPEEAAVVQGTQELHRSDILHAIAPQITGRESDGHRVGSPPRRPGAGSTPAGTPTPTPTSKGGQTTISESELMRRRRLLDSHLISTDSVPGR